MSTPAVMPQNKALSDQQIDEYQRDGFLTPVPILDAQQVETYCGHFEDFEAAWGEPVKRADSLHLVFPWAHELACRPLETVAQLLAPGLQASDVLIWGTLAFCKYPQDQGFVPWHQDGAYADYLAGAPSLSAWIALTPSTEENGCMRFSPGSHRCRLAHTRNATTDNLLKQQHELDGKAFDETAVSAVLRRGEMSLHHLDLAHGSRANTTAEKRLGFIIRYTTLAAASSGQLKPEACPRGLIGAQDRPPQRPLAEAIAVYRKLRAGKAADAD